MQKILESRMSKHLGLMEQVREHSQGSMLHFEPPPPPADVVHMESDLHCSIETDMPYEVSPFALRYKMWCLQSRILQRWCSERDVEFVRCPEEAVAEQGGLINEYYGDYAHGNAAYGWQVLQQMKQRL